jgi:hypothetical protein
LGEETGNADERVNGLEQEAKRAKQDINLQAWSINAAVDISRRRNTS